MRTYAKIRVFSYRGSYALWIITERINIFLNQVDTPMKYGLSFLKRIQQAGWKEIDYTIFNKNNYTRCNVGWF